MTKESLLKRGDLVKMKGEWEELDALHPEAAGSDHASCEACLAPVEEAEEEKPKKATKKRKVKR